MKEVPKRLEPPQVEWDRRHPPRSPKQSPQTLQHSLSFSPSFPSMRCQYCSRNVAFRDDDGESFRGR